MRLHNNNQKIEKRYTCVETAQPKRFGTKNATCGMMEQLVAINSGRHGTLEVPSPVLDSRPGCLQPLTADRLGSL